MSRLVAICAFTNVSAFAQQLPTANAEKDSRAAIAIDYETARLTKVVTAVRIREKITIDGYLDEPAWQLASPATDFTQWGRPGLPATNKSEVRFLYDDDNLYVGFDCWDKDIAHRVVNELREDFNFRATDGVSVYIDSLHDRRSGFMVGTNPVGARRDSQISNDGNSNNNWDGVWDVKVSVDERGWIAEFVIPFKTLRFSNAPEQEWGLNLSRRILSLSEEDVWAPIPIRFGCCFKVSLAGTLRGLENLNPGRNLKVKPFVTAGITDVRNGGQMQRIRSLGGLKDYEGGVDVKYGLTPSLTLDMTYHTDFAQVEADQQQVNLTRFSLFFPEKRDFFLENAGTFTFGPGENLIPFFSRRIGLSGSGVPIPIVAGARLTGTADRYDIGLLAMKAEKLDTSASTIPSNNFFVGRVKRNLLTRSWVGTIVTSRDSTTVGDYSRMYGTDAHFVFHDRLEFDSYVLRSDMPGKTGKNQARRFQTGWRENEWAITGQYNQVQANFNPEVGFVRRKNHSQYSADFAWTPQLRNSETIRNLNFATTVDYFKGGTGKIETRRQDLTLGIRFQSNGAASFTMAQTFDRLEKGVIIQGLPIPAGDYKYLDYTAEFNTDASDKISGSGNINWGEFWHGRRRSLTGGLALKPHYRFNATFEYTRNVVELPSGLSTTDLVGARFLYGFSPRSFVNAFFQYNSETHEVSTNIRFNLTYRPLSDIYLVYNDRRSSQGNELMERALIVKVTNLLNF
jgi:hypothetical protein